MSQGGWNLYKHCGKQYTKINKLKPENRQRLGDLQTDFNSLGQEHRKQNVKNM